LWTITDASNVVAARLLYGEGVDQVQGRIVEAGANAGTQGLYATDNLGSVRDIIGAATGEVLFHAEYDAFGAATEYGAGYGDTLKYTARELDADTGLQYNRARWYDNSVGRWLSEDPIGFAAGDHNLYRYVSNFATGATDPSGLEEVIYFDLTHADERAGGPAQKIFVSSLKDVVDHLKKSKVLYDKIYLGAHGGPGYMSRKEAAEFVIQAGFTTQARIEGPDQIAASENVEAVRNIGKYLVNGGTVVLVSCRTLDLSDPIAVKFEKEWNTLLGPGKSVVGFSENVFWLPNGEVITVAEMKRRNSGWVGSLIDWFSTPPRVNPANRNPWITRPDSIMNRAP
jgi:RHS repeat-associated protein